MRVPGPNINGMDAGGGRHQTAFIRRPNTNSVDPFVPFAIQASHLLYIERNFYSTNIEMDYNQNGSPVT